MNKQHFFAASWCTWKVDTDIEKLIRFMKKEGRIFGLYLVPVAMGTDYEIEKFKPVVEGTVFLTTIHPK